MSHSTIISTLNELAEIDKDGEEHFIALAKKVSNPELRAILTHRAKEYLAATTELQHLVRILGGEPSTTGTVTGVIQRGWEELKAAVAPQDNHDILEQCERGEDYAKKRYSEALRQALPPNVRFPVQKQYETVLRSHDRIRSLRDHTIAA
jgi:uncharacterized protein (TIGR02284 family)